MRRISLSQALSAGLAEGKGVRIVTADRNRRSRLAHCGRPTRRSRLTLTAQVETAVLARAAPSQHRRGISHVDCLGPATVATHNLITTYNALRARELCWVQANRIVMNPCGDEGHAAADAHFRMLRPWQFSKEPVLEMRDRRWETCSAHRRKDH